MSSNKYFSVIIPTFNRPSQLAGCLNAVDLQTYPQDQIEVIVVDDGSKQSMASTVATFEDRLNIKLVRKENAGPAAARNTGAKNASGRYLAFTDDDCQPQADWLFEMAALCADGSDRIIGGRTINALPLNLFSTASQQLVSYIYDYYSGEGGRIQFFASNNMVAPARQFLEIGGFDTSFPLAAGEDRELCDRWLFKGFSTVYAPAAVVRHAHPMTLRSFWRQHFNYGRGAFFYHEKRAKMSSQGIRVEPFSFYRDLLLYPLSQSKGFRSWLLIGLMFVSQLANGLGFFFEVWPKKKGRKPSGT